MTALTNSSAFSRSIDNCRCTAGRIARIGQRGFRPHQDGRGYVCSPALDIAFHAGFSIEQRTL